MGYNGVFLQILLSFIRSLFNQPFGLLKTDEIVNEKHNKGGYNSSIIIWNTS